MASNLTVADTLSVSSTSATGTPYNKVALRKGHGILDWVRLGNTASDLAGTGGKLLKVSYEELAKHNKRDDAWIALKGMVYNVTPYFEYHPGGEDQLMRGIGSDATELFNEVHKWVNFSSVLQKCFVGTLTEPKITFFRPSLALFKKKFNALNDSGLKAPVNPQLSSSQKILVESQSFEQQPGPRYDWFQTKLLIDIAIYSKWKDIRKYHVIVRNLNKSIKVAVYIRENVFTVHVDLHKEVEDSFQVKIGNESGKVDVLLNKVEQGVRWPLLGNFLLGHNQVVSTILQEVEYVECKITEKRDINYNTYLYTLELPQNVHMLVPTGYHVYIRIPGSDCVKPYTPVVTPFKVEKHDVEEAKSIQIFFKVYPAGELTPNLLALQQNDTLEVSFPEGPFPVEVLEKAIFGASFVILIGAGTGITPMIKIMLEALSNDVKTVLLAFNRTEKDIPWKLELDALMVSFSNILRVTHILSSASATWEGRTGRVNKGMLDDILPIPDSEKHCTICICGPKGFTDLSISLILELGYSEENVFAFTG